MARASHDAMIAHPDLGAKIISRIKADCRIVRIPWDTPDWRLGAGSATSGRVTRCAVTTFERDQLALPGVA